MNRFTLDNRTRKIMVEASEHASTEAIREQFKVNKKSLLLIKGVRSSGVF